MTLYKQHDIYWVDLNSTQGAETRKKRPCVIMQATIVNHSSRTLIVAPLLPDHKNWPFVVNITPTPENGLDKPRHINLKQLRAVDVSRLSNKQGTLNDDYFSPIENALRIIFGI